MCFQLCTSQACFVTHGTDRHPFFSPQKNIDLNCFENITEDTERERKPKHQVGLKYGSSGSWDRHSNLFATATTDKYFFCLFSVQFFSRSWNWRPRFKATPKKPVWISAVGKIWSGKNWQKVLIRSGKKETKSRSSIFYPTCAFLPQAAHLGTNLLRGNNYVASLEGPV